jgi:hypothetical protein
MRSSGIWRLGISAAIVIAAFVVVAVLSPRSTAGPCEAISRATLPEVPEASGLAVSRRHPSVLWTHNDSGHAPELFALDTSGIMQGRVRLPIRTRDWEDVSAGRCPAGECLYIADIGDNDFARPRVQVYRVPEPELRARQTARPDVFNVTYPAGAPHNAEALFVAGGRIFIVTKDRAGALYGSAEPLGRNGDVALQRLGQLDLGAVTDAEASPDETSVAVRTSREVVIYRTADLAAGKIDPRTRISIDGLGEPQGEAVALGDTGMLYLAGEGRPWNRAGRFISLRCGVESPTTLP